MSLVPIRQRTFQRLSSCGADSWPRVWANTPQQTQTERAACCPERTECKAEILQIKEKGCRRSQFVLSVPHWPKDERRGGGVSYSEKAGQNDFPVGRIGKKRACVCVYVCMCVGAYSSQGGQRGDGQKSMLSFSLPQNDDASLCDILQAQNLASAEYSFTLEEEKPCLNIVMGNSNHDEDPIPAVCISFPALLVGNVKRFPCLTGKGDEKQAVVWPIIRIEAFLHPLPVQFNRALYCPQAVPPRWLWKLWSDIIF